MWNVFLPNMDGDDDRAIEMINCPSEGIRTILAFVNGHDGGV